MAGKNRTLESCIIKYGSEEGLIQYERLERERIKRQVRITASDFEEDLISCQECGKKMKRISPTHLKNGCTITMTSKEYREKYPDSPMTSESMRSLTGYTKFSCIERHGEEEGLRRWNEYQQTQSISNTFEYKQEKYGWTREQFDDFNKSRSGTLELFVKRHGEKLGLEKWDIYVESQRYTTTLEYFVKKYGIDEGTRRWTAFDLSRLHNGGNSISDAEIGVYNTLCEKGIVLESQYKIKANRWYVYDFAIPEKKILIEFNGDFWHMNPMKYIASDIQARTGRTASEVWENDREKKRVAEEFGYQIYVIWESDWKKRSDDIINEIKRLYE